MKQLKIWHVAILLVVVSLTGLVWPQASTWLRTQYLDVYRNAVIHSALTLGGSIISDTDSQDDLGSSSIYWKAIYGDSVDVNLRLNMGGSARVDGSLTSETDGTDNLGSSSVRWLDLYADSIDVNNSLNIGSSATVDGNLISETTATDDIGSSSVDWLRAYVDSVIAEHVRVNDLIQMNGDTSYIDGGAGIGGTATFTTTDTVDTVAFASAAGVDASSIFVVSLVDTSFAAGVGALKGWISKADTLFVRRKPSGTSGGKWSYLRVQ